MLNNNFVNFEEELFHVIRTRTTTFEDYSRGYAGGQRR